MLIISEFNSPVGKLILSSNGRALLGVYANAGTGKYGNCPILDKAKSWLGEYFSGNKPNPDCLPIELLGTDFQKKVWNSLMKIPYGKTVSYADIAKSIDCKSARAVGAAIGKNPILIVVPCHRVIGKNGSLTGFSAGLDIKIKLLKIEGSL